MRLPAWARPHPCGAAAVSACRPPPLASCPPLVRLLLLLHDAQTTVCCHVDKRWCDSVLVCLRAPFFAAAVSSRSSSRKSARRYGHSGHCLKTPSCTVFLRRGSCRQYKHCQRTRFCFSGRVATARLYVPRAWGEAQANEHAVPPLVCALALFAAAVVGLFGAWRR